MFLIYVKKCLFAKNVSKENYLRKVVKSRENYVCLPFNILRNYFFCSKFREKICLRQNKDLVNNLQFKKLWISVLNSLKILLLDSSAS